MIALHVKNKSQDTSPFTNPWLYKFLPNFWPDNWRFNLGKVSKKKKSAEFSALFKTHPPHSQSAEKN